MSSVWNWNVRLLRIGGTSIRLHGFLFGLIFFEIIRWAFFGSIAYGIGLMASLLGCVLVHELAHCLMAHRCRLEIGEMNLWPLGSMSLVGHSRTPGEEIWVALGGPVINLTVAALFAGIWTSSGFPLTVSLLHPLTDWDIYPVAMIKLNLVLAAVNLVVPAYPLDGGRISNGMLSLWLGPYRAIQITSTIAVLMAAALCAWGLYELQPVVVFFSLFIFVQTAFTRRAARYGEWMDYAEGRQTFRHDQPGFFARWKTRRDARRRQQFEQARRQLREEVDQILDKVSRVGMAGLTSAEKSQLEAASRMMREFGE